jgi:hypothetical protein
MGSGNDFDKPLPKMVELDGIPAGVSEKTTFEGLNTSFRNSRER